MSSWVHRAAPPRHRIAVLTVATAAALALLAGCGSAPPPPAAPPAGQSQRPAGPPAEAVDPLLAPALDGAEPKAAHEPAALGRQIGVSEAAIRDPASEPRVVAAAGRTAQVAYMALADRPAWDADVLAGVPAPLRPVVRGNLAAARDLRSLSPTPSETLPAWRIVEPQPAEALRAHYAEAERRFGVPWTVLAAVHLVETGMGRIAGLSAAGAQGPMQFIPATWESYGMGGDVWDTRDAVLGAANYLAANGAAERTGPALDRALYRYNNDTRYVRAVRHYAAVMHADERAYDGYRARQVYHRTTAGEVLLPTGYESQRPVPVHEWLARRPR